VTTGTREQFVAAAKGLFARKGFYGASIAAIARELGLTKQALLHHFGSKEKLYGEVLRHISEELTRACTPIVESSTDPASRLEQLVLLQYRSQMADQDAARLIMRELLDNDQRAENAGNWFLKPYLEVLVDTVLEIDSLRALGRGKALALIYQLLGAAHYFAVSQPTLKSIFGEPLFSDARESYEAALSQLIRARLQACA